MNILLAILFLLLFSLLAASSVWALSLLVFQENWKGFTISLLMPPLAAGWIFFVDGERPERSALGRYSVEGLVLAGTLLLPLWVTFMLLVGFVALETYLLYEDEDFDDPEEDPPSDRRGRRAPS